MRFCGRLFASSPERWCLRRVGHAGDCDDVKERDLERTTVPGLVRRENPDYRHVDERSVPTPAELKRRVRSGF